MKNWAFAVIFFFTRLSQFQLTSRHFKCSSNKTTSKTFVQIINKVFLNTLRPECFRPKCSFGYVGCKYDDKSQNFFGSTMKNIHNFSEFWTFSLKLFHCTWRLKNSEDQPKFIRSVFKKGWFSWNPQMIFLPCFPGSETCWQKIPTRKVFPQNGEKHEYTKFLQKITLSAEFFFSNQVYCRNEIKIQNDFSQCVKRLWNIQHFHRSLLKKLFLATENLIGQN